LIRLDAGEDLVGGLGPHERAWVLVAAVDPIADVGVELAERAMRAAFEFAIGRLAKPVGTSRSRVCRNRLNSIARWRWCSEPITLPPAISGAANSVEVPVVVRGALGRSR
jgi:hypothetical protein